MFFFNHSRLNSSNIESIPKSTEKSLDSVSVPKYFPFSIVVWSSVKKLYLLFLSYNRLDSSNIESIPKVHKSLRISNLVVNVVCFLNRVARSKSNAYCSLTATD